MALTIKNNTIHAPITENWILSWHEENSLTIIIMEQLVKNYSPYYTKLLNHVKAMTCEHVRNEDLMARYG
jgi:hypothetical protein